MRLGDVAKELGITRANVHYHFGSKQQLVEEIVSEYMTALLSRYRAIWLDAPCSFEERVLATIEFNKWRFRQFHDGTLLGNNPWSLIDRMRNDILDLSEETRQILTRLQVIESYIAEAARAAHESGELSTAFPAESIALQFSVVIGCASTITQYRGGFAALEQVYLNLYEAMRASARR